MLSLALAFSAPLKSSLSSSKTPSKPKLCPTTNGHHPQSWIANSSISSRSTRSTVANTLRYCSSSSSYSIDTVFILVCNISSSARCNNTLKSSATTFDRALNNSDTPTGIARSTVCSFIFSQSNSVLCNKSHTVVGSIGLTATRRFILFWPRIAGAVRGDICVRQAPTLATTRECASERSVNMFSNELATPMHDQIP